MPVNGKPNGRFELPQFTPLNFSLTEGTDIPPPPDSPIEEKPPPQAPKVDTAVANGHGNANGNGTGVYDGRGRSTVGVYSSGQGAATDDKPPMSPTSSHRPSSIRRFLSRKSLNTNYEDGTNTNMSREDLMQMDRPDSAMSFASTTRPEMSKKRSSSWFRRFSSTGGGNRTSTIYEDKKQQVVTPMGPPPPKLPELSNLKAKIPENDEGSLGAEDMFKNIK